MLAQRAETASKNHHHQGDEHERQDGGDGGGGGFSGARKVVRGNLVEQRSSAPDNRASDALAIRQGLWHTRTSAVALQKALLKKIGGVHTGKASGKPSRSRIVDTRGQREIRHGVGHGNGAYRIS